MHSKHTRSFSGVRQRRWEGGTAGGVVHVSSCQQETSTRRRAAALPRHVQINSSTASRARHLVKGPYSAVKYCNGMCCTSCSGRATNSLPLMLTAVGHKGHRGCRKSSGAGSGLAKAGAGRVQAHPRPSRGRGCRCSATAAPQATITAGDAASPWELKRSGVQAADLAVTDVPAAAGANGPPGGVGWRTMMGRAAD